MTDTHVTPPAPPSGAPTIQNTATIGISTTGGLVIVEWLVQPSWPPPTAVLTIAVGLLTPIIHLVGRAVYRKVASWAGEPATNGNGAPHA